MKNARIHEALCLLFPAADPRTAWNLEQGPRTNFEIAITQWNLPDPQPTQSQLDAAYLQLTKADRCAAIQRELDAIDLQSVRPVRAKLAGTATAEDETRLASLEAQAQTLRAELAGLPQ
jgi:hypothetical protein